MNWNPLSVRVLCRSIKSVNFFVCFGYIRIILILKFLFSLIHCLFSCYLYFVVFNHIFSICYPRLWSAHDCISVASGLGHMQILLVFSGCPTQSWLSPYMRNCLESGIYKQIVYLELQIPPILTTCLTRCPLPWRISGNYTTLLRNRLPRNLKSKD